MCMIAAVLLPLIIFSSPRILYEKVDGGYAVRYYLFGLTNFTTATIPEKHNNEYPHRNESREWTYPRP